MAMKKFRPTTPTRRFTTLVKRDDITKQQPEKSLVEGKKRARIGRYLYSVGSNEQATLLSGVDVFRVKLFAYGISALLGGVAGILWAGYGGQGDPQTGTGFGARLRGRPGGVRARRVDLSPSRGRVQTCPGRGWWVPRQPAALAHRRR